MEKFFVCVDVTDDFPLKVWWVEVFIAIIISLVAMIVIFNS